MLPLLRTRRISSQYPHQSLKVTLRAVSTMSQRRFFPSRLDHIEEIEEYRPGGLHPVSIGDNFANGRYHVLHKLGFGGSSTVWLARSSASGSLVTLKVMRAEQSARPKDEIAELIVPQKLGAFLRGKSPRPNIQLIEDHFMQEGPNGSHLCLVFQLAGPSVQSMTDCPGRVMGTRRLRSDLARKVAKQAASVVELMHSAGLVHGDLTTSNILFRVSEHVRHWADREIYAFLGEPETEKIRTRDRSPPGPSAPTELVAPIDNARLSSSSLLQENVTVIDFGQSFATECPPKGYEPATAMHYVSPEARFESRICPASDIWALACTIFEIRAGFPLFEPFLGSDTEILKETVQTFGRLPEPWWSSFEERELWFEESGEPKPADVQEHAGIMLPAVKSSIRTKLREIGGQDEPTQADGSMFEKAGTRLEEEEVELLGDLLEQMLRYLPEYRITVRDVMQHPWFSKYE